MRPLEPVRGTEKNLIHRLCRLPAGVRAWLDVSDRTKTLESYYCTRGPRGPKKPCFEDRRRPGPARDGRNACCCLLLPPTYAVAQGTHYSQQEKRKEGGGEAEWASLASCKCCVPGGSKNPLRRAHAGAH